MKKLFLLLTLFGVLCSSCTDSGDDVKNPQRPSPEDSVFTISGDGSYVVGAEGGNVVVEVTTNLEYKVVIPEEAEWLTLADTRAVREESLTFIVEKNEELEERSVVVVIVDAQGKELKSLNIKQEAEEPVFTTDSEGNYIIKAEGGDVVVNVTTNLEYDIVIPADASWVTIAESRAVREESLTFSVAKNEEASERIAKILLVDANAETLQEIIFIQEHDVEKVPLNQIWYTSIDGNKIEFNSDDSGEEYADPFNIFGANIVSHKYEDGEGVITFDDEIKKIGEDAFRKCTSLESITIPDSVTEIGEYAFEECTNLKSITIPDSVVTIGEGAFCECTSLESVTIGNGVTEIGEGAFYVCTSLESIDIPNSVTEIGEYAFAGCSNLKEFKGKYASEDGRCLIVDGVLKAFAIGCGATEYTIPDSVTTIGECAFGGCSSLTSVTIPDSVVTIGEYAFSVCTSLESVTIGNGVTEIGDSAFGNCSNLKEFKGKYASEDGRCLIVDGVLTSFASAGLTEYTIPDSVTKIGESVFFLCKNLTSIVIPDSVVTIGASAFDECTGLKSVTIGNGVTKIGEFAFYGCTSLESVTIGNSVTEIGEDAFAKCTSLESINIPDSVVTIGEYAFAVCTSLESVTIGNGVTEIGEATFYACTSLKSVTIGNSVTEIGWRAFEGCTSLESINIPDSVVTIGWNAFDGCTGLKSVTIGNSVTEIGEFAFVWCISLDSIFIPDSVVTIGYAAFYGCTSLESVTAGNSVTEIGEYAFCFCENLTSIVIPDSVVTIGESAFWYCTSLESVTIGNSVTEIGKDAFLNCENLEIVYCKPFTPPYLGSGNFDYVQTIYVPAKSIETYKTVDVWYEFADYYIGYDFEKGEVVEPAIPNNTITYTATSKVEPYSGERNNYADAFTTFGANIVSHSYENGKGVITFDNDVTKIGEFAFYACKSLESITIPNSVTEIEQYAFEHCKFTSITIPDSVTTIADESFGGCSHLYEFKGKFASEDGRCLIVDDVLKAFAPAGLTEYTIPYGVVEIGRGAFFYYKDITSVTIPNSVIKIGFAAFEYCSSLTHMVIPNSVTEISEYAFNMCDSLDSIHCTSTIPPHLGLFAFWNTNTNTQLYCKIYVPVESYQDYISADNWMEYAVNIRPYDYNNNCTIESGVSEDTMRWLGKWNSTVNWTYCPDVGWNDEPVTFEINIEHNTVAPNLVKIYGLSVVDPTIAVDGVVNKNGDLVILSCNYAGYDGEWLLYMWALSESGNISYVRHAVYTMSMDESGNVSCNVGSLNGSPYFVFDIFAYNANTGGISWYDSSLSYYSGPMSWVKIENGPAALSSYSATVPYRANFQPQVDTRLKVVE